MEAYMLIPFVFIIGVMLLGFRDWAKRNWKIVLLVISLALLTHVMTARITIVIAVAFSVATTAKYYTNKKSGDKEDIFEVVLFGVLATSAALIIVFSTIGILET
ncbi:hypothetical protein J4N42_18100 [Vibrio sp. SCSIO 43135]|uniref:hypothetical protein n=1 Tax=Vibrio sp. SCSIO 43135 TaxID=2819096 RepID=UPI002074E691|nr:hypothetical protein [Vibrio sp. SCSIO 43135]USD44056.1 hypothetical protein J4N42_18100 [Vibrio sp. SCSIO 43135]